MRVFSDPQEKVANLKGIISGRSQGHSKLCLISFNGAYDNN